MRIKTKTSWVLGFEYIGLEDGRLFYLAGNSKLYLSGMSQPVKFKYWKFVACPFCHQLIKNWHECPDFNTEFVRLRLLGKL